MKYTMKSLFMLAVASCVLIFACSSGEAGNYSEFSNLPISRPPAQGFTPYTMPEPRNPFKYILTAKGLNNNFPKLHDNLQEELGNCPNADTLVRDCHGISYNGGPVMSDPINVYLIWYGKWDQAYAKDAKRIVEEFITNLGGSDYWMINQMYCDNHNHCVSGTIKLAGTINKPDYLQKDFLSETDIGFIATNTIKTKEFPSDVNGMYLVLTSNEVGVMDSCGSFCGWHDHALLDGVEIKHSFIQDVAKCPESCTTFSDNFVNLAPPNNNISGDGMVNIVLHEMSEMATDPLPSIDGSTSAWADNFYESSDKCSWNFPHTYKTAAGSDANIKLRSGDYLGQGQWVLKNQGYCDVSTTGEAP